MSSIRSDPKICVGFYFSVQNDWLIGWYKYNLPSASVNAFQDGNGYIDEQELDALLRDLYQKNKKVRGEENLSEGSSEIHAGCRH